MTRAELEAIKARMLKAAHLAVEGDEVTEEDLEFICVDGHALVAEVERLDELEKLKGIVNTTVPGLVAREEWQANLLSHIRDKMLKKEESMGVADPLCETCNDIRNFNDDQKNKEIT